MGGKTISPRIFTIGHSNRTIKDFLALLEMKKLKFVIDVRTVPKSRHNPQFGESRLKRTLTLHKIQYLHMAGLGGFRHTAQDSVNMGWHNSSFRGFADYMQTSEFKKNLNHLITLSKRKRLVIMCAEAVPWRCHRSLIADALLINGFPVEDIISKTSVRSHTLTSFAKVRGKKITYPAPES